MSIVLQKITYNISDFECINDIYAEFSKTKLSALEIKITAKKVAFKIDMGFDDHQFYTKRYDGKAVKKYIYKPPL